MTDAISDADILEAFRGLMEHAATASKALLDKGSYSTGDWLRNAFIEIFGHEMTRKAVQAQVIEGLKADPRAFIDPIFRNSGQVVKTNATDALDKIIASSITDNEGAFASWIQDYMKANMERLLIEALARTILAALTGTLNQIASDSMASTRELISSAFMQARMNVPGRY